MEENLQYDVIIAGAGVGGLYTALQLPRDKKILVLCKEGLDMSDSFLAQGGICMLRGEYDYDSYFEDTMRAGHYENNQSSVDLMIRSSPDIIADLVACGARFQRNEDGSFAFTREGAHSAPRILFHEDCTGREITSHLLKCVEKLPNVTLRPHCTVLDILCDRECRGVVVLENKTGRLFSVYAPYTVLATGGLGGVFHHSTNFRHLTGDALAICYRHGIAVEHISYIQIHPTTLYSKKRGRRFLISESVRGEGAVLLNAKGERFTEELQPRDVVTAAIRAQMAAEGSDHVWLDMRPIGAAEIAGHFPTIVKRCEEEGYDVFTQPIPVVPAQHYFMGGVKVDLNSKTSMDRLYAVGETSCNGVHGKNRLASNSLLESLAFAKQAARDIARTWSEPTSQPPAADFEAYADRKKLWRQYKQKILTEIEKEERANA